MTLSIDQTLAAYIAARHRMPEADTRGRAAAPARDLSEIADDYDAFFLDAFGVLNIGATAIPDAAARVAELQRAGKRVLVVSNAATLPHADLCAKYARLGFDFAPEDVVSSRMALSRAVDGGDGRTWGLMIPDDVDAGEFAALDHTRLMDDPAAYDACDGVLMIGSASWSEDRQRMLEDTLAARPRPVLVGNPDLTAPHEDGATLEPGLFAHRLADRTGVKPDFYGKPFGNIYDIAFERLGPGFDPSRVLMVGDTPHTDVLGGAAAGIRTALVTGHGFLKGRDVTADLAASGLAPDHVLETT